MSEYVILIDVEGKPRTFEISDFYEQLMKNNMKLLGMDFGVVVEVFKMFRIKRIAPTKENVKLILKSEE